MADIKHPSLAAVARLVAAIALACLLALPLAACDALPLASLATPAAASGPAWFDLESIPAYDGSPTVEVNGNAPLFEEADFARGAFEEYSSLDNRGRCGAAFALIGEETMPTEPRGDISSVKPSGWQYDQYDWVDQKYLFNRCHLIGWQLAGENDNERNLITGTRYMNVEGMLPYENRVAWYVAQTGNHVLYRVTPVFEGRNLVASGVLMEAESVEDIGSGVRFCVWCYNVEPGVSIDYATGESRADGTIAANGEADAATTSSSANGVAPAPSPAANGEKSFTVPGEEFRASEADARYVLNIGSGKIHIPQCPSVADMKEHNKFPFNGTREQAIELGFEPCGACKP